MPDVTGIFVVSGQKWSWGMANDNGCAGDWCLGFPRSRAAPNAMELVKGWVAVDQVEGLAVNYNVQVVRKR